MPSHAEQVEWFGVYHCISQSLMMRQQVQQFTRKSGNTIEVEGSGGRGLLHSIQQEHIWAANGKHITIRVEWSLLVGGTGLIYPTVGLWCPNSRPRRASSNSLSSSLSNKTKQTKQTQLLLDSLVQSMNQGWTGGTGGKSQANLATMEVPMKDFGAEVPGG